MFKKVLFGTLTVFVGLALLEAGGRLLERVGGTEGNRFDSWQTEFFSQAFAWHKPDPDLLWRFRSNLTTNHITTSELGLVGESLPASGDRPMFRILLLGDSSPVGLGLESYRLNFGERLKEILQLQLGEKAEVQLANAAVAGYSSEQVRRWFEIHGTAFEPDLVLVYCGNNDASLSGGLSDRDLLTRQQLTGLRQVLSGSAVYRLLRGLWLSACQSERHVSLLGESNPILRCSPAEYRENLIRIGQVCDSLICPMVIIQPIVPLLWPAGLQFRVFRHMAGSDGSLVVSSVIRDILGRELRYCLDWDELSSRLGDLDQFTRTVYASAYHDSLPPEQAIEHYQKLVATEADDPVLRNNLGVALWEAGDYGAAITQSTRAREIFCSQHPPPRGPAMEAAGSPFLYNAGIASLSAALSQADTTGARQLLDSALETDFLSLRIKGMYLDRIAEVIVAGSGSWHTLSLERAFGRSSDNPWAAETLFVDHCHPTASGHRIIAEHLAQLLGQLGILDGKKKSRP